jgi:hypothetical protein
VWKEEKDLDAFNGALDVVNQCKRSHALLESFLGWFLGILVVILS